MPCGVVREVRFDLIRREGQLLPRRRLRELCHVTPVAPAVEIPLVELQKFRAEQQLFCSDIAVLQTASKTVGGETGREGC